MTYMINARIGNERRTTTAETPQEALAAGRGYEDVGATAASITLPVGGTMTVEEFARFDTPAAT